MRKIILLLALVFFTIAVTDSISNAQRRISVPELKDKIMGGWVGQGVGVQYGAPYEFKYCGKMVDCEMRPWTPERLEGSLGQDDLYVDMTFVATLEAYGPDVTFEQAGHAFGSTLYRLWHANNQARENIRNGIMPPMSGHPKNNIHADDIGFQIESDGLGMVCPGLPQMSNDLCDVFGHIMCYGDGVYGGMWVAAMYTQAFFETDPAKILAAGLKAIPPQSKFAQCISDVVKWHAQYPDDWTQTWQQIEDNYQDNIDCTARGAFNIDARVNAAYVATGMLYGGGDMAKTLEIATRCGQDADCNPSTACGILGCSMGLSNMEEQYRSHLPKLAGRKFSHTNYSYDTVTDACLKIARQTIEKAGGSFETIDGVEYAIIPDQEPLPPLTFEQWPDEQQKRRLGIE